MYYPLCIHTNNILNQKPQHFPLFRLILNNATQVFHTIIRILPRKHQAYLYYTKIISIFAINMSKIIDYVEKLRVQQRAKKKELCKFAGISPNSYTNYLNGSKPTFETVKSMLEYLGQELITIDKKHQL